ncbi:Uncharacterized protein HZ326_6757 [Fusarium oxysporum f. sp. albedinis]|nr:Uncharacterized protein HZ326_6757 [Fusarium oxysporum f. sp. albedinis]
MQRQSNNDNSPAIDALMMTSTGLGCWSVDYSTRRRACLSLLGERPVQFRLGPWGLEADCSAIVGHHGPGTPGLAKSDFCASDAFVGNLGLKTGMPIVCRLQETTLTTRPRDGPARLSLR